VRSDPHRLDPHQRGERTSSHQAASIQAPTTQRAATNPTAAIDPSRDTGVTSGWSPHWPSSLELFGEAIDHALAANEFTLVYQPKVSLSSNRVVGFEALIRWLMPNGSTVTPIDLLAVAEASGRTDRIGEWVLAHAFAQHVEWQHADPATPLTIAVNVARGQFGSRLLPAVRAAAENTGIDPSAVSLELTVSTVMDDIGGALAVLNELRSHGFRVSLDDFGADHMCLAQLRRVPLDELKIDGRFVHGLTANPIDTAIVTSAINLAHAMGCEATAEAVETSAQLTRLRELGCDAAQGFLIAPPLAAHQIGSYLAAKPPDPRTPPHPEPRATSTSPGRPLTTTPAARADLSGRQHEIIERLLRGERVPTIARALYLSPSTVRNHLTAIYRKLGVHSQEELIRMLRHPG
jgi:EAL domain-containing protein (putative c-di-GMP-specific phosphodiesterase class I)/DNA-binding CsgD family transcriptional regulator